MNQVKRPLSASLSVFLLLTAPGLAPYEAAAQTLRAASVPAAIAPLAAAAASLPRFSAPAVSLAPPVSLVPTIRAAPVSVKAAPTVQAIKALQGGAKSVAAAIRKDSADAPRAALDGLFEGEAPRPDAASVFASGETAVTASLGKPYVGSASGPGRTDRLLPPNNLSPETSIKRTLSVGLLAAVLPIALGIVASVIASLLGYQQHPNYQGPEVSDGPSLLEAFKLLAEVSVVAPILEEFIFRAGVQGALTKLWEKLKWGSFAVPALISSLFFVALHETSDPLIFAIRLASALAWGYVYQKEGILSSMTAHSINNGLLALPVVLTALGVPWLSLAIVPVMLYLSYKSYKVLRAQRPAIESGALTPKLLTRNIGMILAAAAILAATLL